MEAVGCCELISSDLELLDFNCIASWLFDYVDKQQRMFMKDIRIVYYQEYKARRADFVWCLTAQRSATRRACRSLTLFERPVGGGRGAQNMPPKQKKGGGKKAGAAAAAAGDAAAGGGTSASASSAAAEQAPSPHAAQYEASASAFKDDVAALAQCLVRWPSLASDAGAGWPMRM